MRNQSPYELRPFTIQPFGLGAPILPAYDVLPAGPSDYYTYNPPLFVEPRPVVTPILTVSPKPVSSTAAVIPATMPTASTATMTLKTTIKDSIGAVPANVTIDGKAYANTENGYIQITGVNINSIVTITSVGFKPYSAKASQVPATVILTEDSENLQEVVVTPKPKPKSNLGLWLLLGAATIAVVASQSGKKQKASLGLPVKVKAKI